MAASQDCFETLLMAQTLRLREDRVMLERLYGLLASGSADSEQRMHFTGLLSDVKDRAERLEIMLDEMAAMNIADNAQPVFVCTDLTAA